MSQNAVFWGSGYHGAAGDSVLSLGVVTGTGDFIETGSAAQKMPSPFHGISAPISRVCLSVTAVPGHQGHGDAASDHRTQGESICRLCLPRRTQHDVCDG